MKLLSQAISSTRGLLPLFLLLYYKDLNMPTVYLLDYVAGNVRSLVNAIEKVGYTVEWVRSPADVPAADVCLPCNCATNMPN